MYTSRYTSIYSIHCYVSEKYIDYKDFLIYLLKLLSRPWTLGTAPRMLCQESVAPMYCEDYHTHLFKDFIEKHLSHSSKVHKMVSFQQYLISL